MVLLDLSSSFAAIQDTLTHPFAFLSPRLVSPADPTRSKLFDLGFDVTAAGQRPA